MAGLTPLRLKADGQNQPHPMLRHPPRKSDVTAGRIVVAWAKGQNNANLPFNYPGPGGYFSRFSSRSVPAVPQDYPRVGHPLTLPRCVRLVTNNGPVHGLPGEGMGGEPIGSFERRLADGIKEQLAVDRPDVDFVWLNTGSQLGHFYTSLLEVAPLDVYKPPSIANLAYDNAGEVTKISFLGGDCLDLVVAGPHEWNYDPSAYPPGLAPFEYPTAQQAAFLAALAANFNSALRHQYAYFARYRAVVFFRQYATALLTQVGGSPPFTDGRPYSRPVLAGFVSALGDVGFETGPDLSAASNVGTFYEYVLQQWPLDSV